MKHGDILNELGLEVGLAGERGLRLLFILSFIFPSHFLHQGKCKGNTKYDPFRLYILFNMKDPISSKAVINIDYFSPTIEIEDIIKQLISMLAIEGDYVGPLVLSALTYVGRKGNIHILPHSYKKSA